jgi:KaiC/GvpD/RAD55 family RecA-like ATPase
MGYAIKEKKITNVVIDSITGLYEHREVAARQIVRQFFNFLKKWRQTALLVSQKRSAQASESAEAAGGLAVAHILDGTIVLDKKLIETRWDVSLYRLPIGSVLRTLRIDGCRLAPHDSRTWVFEINELGIIDIIAPLEEYIKKK